MEIWIGDCASAGGCDNGPCGPGENDGDDCPAFWMHTAEFDVSYTPGGSVMIDGIPRNPGETFAKLRGDLTVATPLEYPVEYFRDEIEPPGGEWTGDGPPFGITDIIQDGNVWGGSLPGGIYAWNETNKRWQNHQGEPGWYAYVDGEWSNSNGYQMQVEITSPTTADVYYPNPPYNPGEFTRGPFNWVFWVNNGGGFPGPLPPDLIKWRVYAYPNPRQTLVPATDYGDLPLEASPGEATLEWGKYSFADQVTVTGYPSGPVAGKIRLTLRSACENPPP